MLKSPNMLSVPAFQDQRPKVVPCATNDHFDMSTPNLYPLGDDGYYRSPSDESRSNYADASTILGPSLDNESNHFDFDPGFNSSPNWAEPDMWNQGTLDRYSALPVPEPPHEWMMQNLQDVGASTVHVAVSSLLTNVAPITASHPATHQGPFPSQVGYTTQHVPDLLNSVPRHCRALRPMVFWTGCPTSQTRRKARKQLLAAPAKRERRAATLPSTFPAQAVPLPEVSSAHGGISSDSGL